MSNVDALTAKLNGPYAKKDIFEVDIHTCLRPCATFLEVRESNPDINSSDPLCQCVICGLYN